MTFKKSQKMSFNFQSCMRLTYVTFAKRHKNLEASIFFFSFDLQQFGTLREFINGLC